MTRLQELARGLDLAALLEADDGTGGGGGDSPESTDTGNPGEELPATKTFTEDQVAEIVQKRLARANKQHEAAMAELTAQLEKNKNKPKPKPKSDAPDLSDAISQQLEKLTEAVSGIQQRELQKSRDEAFNAAVSGLDLADEFRGLLRAQFDPDKPEATVAMAKQLAAMSSGQPPAGDGYTSPGRGGGSTPPNGMKHPAKWTGEDIARYQAEPGGIRAAWKKYREQTSGGGNPFALRGRKKG